MTLYYYIITRDYGFAPNPFPPYCTLATCKPKIRLAARIGDWVVGIGSGAKNSLLKNKLIYAMQVEEKLSYDEYWDDPRFVYKEPVMNGSKRQKYGDKVYHTNSETGEFIQEDSHHSLNGGIINELNYDTDLKGKYVLISRKYWYFGKDAKLLPEHLLVLANVVRNHKTIKDQDLINHLEDWLSSFKENSYIGSPYLFKRGFERYLGMV
ncbi:Nmad2 family putative nucleotide modification protein [Desulfosporosinus fructosivorans]